MQTTKRIPRESDETLRVRRVTAAQNCLCLLDRLGLHDEKFAIVHLQMSRLHEQGFHKGLNDPAYCNECSTNGTPQHHLNSAVKSLGLAIRVYVRCWGVDSPRLEELSKDTLRLQALGSDYDE